MTDERKRNGVKSLLDAVKSSEGWEAHISLLDQLEDFHPLEASDVALLMECLSALWEDSSCLGISQCTLNRKLLNVAVKFLEINVSESIIHFLTLGTKASIWSRKHLQVSPESVVHTLEEEHSATLSQLVFDSLRFLSATIAALTESINFGVKASMLMVENFIFELLNLTKTSISEIKRFQHISSELIRAAQVTLDTTIKFCKSYFESICSNSDEMTETMKDHDDIKTHVITVTTLTIENLHELGILAAAGGGTLVAILNVSWKGVVSLLQLGKTVLSCKIKIGNILQTLISLANDSLCRAAETWFSSSREGEITLSEAKRMFLPIKFYLINAIRISSDHPREAMEVSREIIKCVFLVPYFGVLFAKEVAFRAASEGLVDILEPTSFLLLYGMLSSNDVAAECKSRILDGIFKDKHKFDAMIPSKHDATSSSGIMTLGRIMIFLNILKCSVAFRDEVISMISMNLGDLMNCIVEGDVYPLILIMHIPLCGYGSKKGISWKPIIHFIMYSIKIFMINAKSLILVDFLHENLFHPHCLVQEIVVELWCFFMRHVEPGVASQIFDRWFSLLNSLASSEAALKPLSPLRRWARSVSRILSHAPQSTIDHVYSSTFDDAGSSMASSVVRVAMMMEGFPLDSLSSNLKKVSSRSILENFQSFVANCEKSHDHGSILLGFPMHAFACALRSSLITESDISEDTGISQLLRFSLYLIREQKNDSDGRLLSTALDIISRVRKSYAVDEIKDVVQELQTLSLSNHLKPALVSFMAGLCRMEMREKEDDPTYSAAWGLYHLILRERNWAFLHLSLEGFGYFAARTPCTQLWRFVPQDAALSYDVDAGNEPREERFMAQLKAFLERETTSGDQLDELRREAVVLHRRILDREEEMREKEMREKERKRKRKIPEEISKGISMLRTGLELLQKGFSTQDGVDFSEQLSGQLSSLQGVILGLSTLSDR